MVGLTPEWQEHRPTKCGYQALKKTFKVLQRESKRLRKGHWHDEPVFLQRQRVLGCHAPLHGCQLFAKMTS